MNTDKIERYAFRVAVMSVAASALLILMLIVLMIAKALL